MAEMAQRVEDAGRTLLDVQRALEPLVDELGVKLADRRLVAADGINVQADHAKYADAIGKIVPTWQSLERMTMDVCEGTHKAVSEVQSLQCRVDGFLKFNSLPGTDQLLTLTGSCDQEAADGVASSSCPSTAHSENIRNTLAENAFFIGMICLGAEYAITYNVATRILFALFCFLLPGMCVEGKAGLLCDWRFLRVTVLVLSVAWAFLVVRGVKCQVFFAGFDLGAILGGLIYLMYEYEQIFDAVLDPDLAKKEIVLLLTCALVSGLALGSIAVAMVKPAIVAGTAAVGAALVVVAVLILSPLVGWGHSLGWVDLPIFLFLFVGGILTQYFVTNPPDGKAELADGQGGWDDKVGDSAEGGGGGGGKYLDEHA